MGLFANILILYLCVAVGFYAFGISTPASAILVGGGDLLKGNLMLTFGGQAVNLLSVAAVAALIVVSMTGGGFSLPLVIGVALAATLLTLFTYPFGVINSVGTPPEVIGLLQAFAYVLQFLFIFSMVNWIKGSGD
jgi:hypothetical protein